MRDVEVLVRLCPGDYVRFHNPIGGEMEGAKIESIEDRGHYWEVWVTDQYGESVASHIPKPAQKMLDCRDWWRSTGKEDRTAVLGRLGKVEKFDQLTQKEAEFAAEVLRLYVEKIDGYYLPHPLLDLNPPGGD